MTLRRSAWVAVAGCACACVWACDELDVSSVHYDGGAHDGGAVDASRPRGTGTVVDEPHCPEATAATPVARGNAVAELDYFVERWDELTAANGERYWYIETNCDPYDGSEVRSYVEVDDGEIVRTERRTGPGCMGCVYRDEVFEPRTMPELLEQCREHVEVATGEDRLTVNGDETGAIWYCRVRPSGCEGVCDLGFHLPGYAFGALPDDVLD